MDEAEANATGSGERGDELFKLGRSGLNVCRLESLISRLRAVICRRSMRARLLVPTGQLRRFVREGDGRES